MYYTDYLFPLIGEVRILVNNLSLHIFTKRQFSNYLLSEGRNSKSGVNYEIVFSDNSIIDCFSRYEQEGLSLSRRDGWKNHELCLGEYRYRISPNSVSIFVTEERDLKHKVKIAYRNIKARTEEQKYAITGGVFYQYLLFPILTVYAATHGLFTVHGSLIKLKNNKTIIISGLDGVGKSTLSELICRDQDNKILADNIVLFNGKEALNLNLAMRLDAKETTDLPVLYQNKLIKEVQIKETTYGLCSIDSIYTLLKNNCDTNIRVMNNDIPVTNWVLFLERAPEIGQANSQLSYWLFMHSLFFGNSNSMIPVMSIAIPYGKLNIAKEIINNEFKVFR